MKLNGRPPKIVLESDVRRAMKHTLSNAQAAKFLGINNDGSLKLKTNNELLSIYSGQILL